MSEPTRLSVWDKILPDQPINNVYYQGERGDYHHTLYELLARASGAQSPFDHFDLELTDVVPPEEMASNPLALSFIAFLAQIVNAERVLEIGAFIGLSAMSLARALPPHGKVISIEKFDHFAGICRRNFERNGLAHKIELVCGDAMQVLPGLDPGGPLDMVFIDGDKERYLDYFELLEPHVRPGGLVVVDDVLFQGDALNPAPVTAKGRGVKRFMDFAESKSDWTRAGLPVSDGMLLMLKPRD